MGYISLPLNLNGIIGITSYYCVILKTMILHDAIKKTIESKVFLFSSKKEQNFVSFLKNPKKRFFFQKKQKSPGGLGVFANSRVFLNPVACTSQSLRQRQFILGFLIASGSGCWSVKTKFSDPGVTILVLLIYELLSIKREFSFRTRATRPMLSSSRLPTRQLPQLKLPPLQKLCSAISSTELKLTMK